MSIMLTPNDWESLKEDCRMVYGCSDFMMNSAIKRKDRKAQKRLEAQRRKIERVHEAARKSIEANPGQTKEQLTGSIIAILLPLVLPILRDWLVSTFEKLIIDWLTNRLKTPTN